MPIFTTQISLIYKLTRTARIPPGRGRKGTYLRRSEDTPGRLVMEACIKYFTRNHYFPLVCQSKFSKN